MTVILPPIGLIGKAGAGKDTAAEILGEFGYTRFALADPLKDIAASIWGEEARRDRAKLQALGRKVREIDEDAWINLLRRRIFAARLRDERSIIDGWVTPSDLLPVITDVRYLNEARSLKVAGFLFIRVEAARDLRVMRLRAGGKLTDEADLEDASETALDDFPTDFTLLNEGTREDLADVLADVLTPVAA